MSTEYTIISTKEADLTVDEHSGKFDVTLHWSRLLSDATMSINDQSPQDIIDAGIKMIHAALYVHPKEEAQAETIERIKNLVF